MPLLNFRNSNKHFAVGFFRNQTLRPLLELMFPEHNVLHLLAQNLLSPSEMVWNKVKDFYETYLLQATSECSCKNPKVSIVSTLMKWSPLCKEQVPAAPHWDGGGARERTYKQILESLEYIQIHRSLCLLSCGWPLPQYEGKHGQIGDMLVLSQVNTKASLHDSQEQLSELSSSKSANTLMSIHTRWLC